MADDVSTAPPEHTTVPSAGRDVSAPARPGRWQRWGPFLTLLLMAPFIAEILLGDISLSSLAIVLVFIPMYGCGALLIRELVRRTGRGWPSIALLALAFGVLEEGLVTFSLFDPHYAGLDLHAGSELPFLGLGGTWTVYVLALHTIWSISTPIAVVEGLFPARGREPWLRRRGVVITTVVLVLGAAVLCLGTVAGGDFRPAAGQIVATVAAAVALIAVAFGLRPRAAAAPGTSRRTLHPGWVVLASLILGGAIRWGGYVHGWWGFAAIVAASAVAVTGFAWAGARFVWRPEHTFAAAAGAVLTYAWTSFFQWPIVGQASTAVVRVGNGLFTLIAIGILLIGARALRRYARREVGPDQQASTVGS